MTFIVLLILFALMQAVRSYAPAAGLGTTPGGTVLAGGFLLLGGYLAGVLFKSLGLPKLTGYLVAGIVAGPSVMHLVSERMIGDLAIFNGLATALIALGAGAELEFDEIKPLLPAIQWITIFGTIGTAIVVSIAIFFGAPYFFDFLNGLTQPALLAVAGLLGVTIAAQSPAVAVALKKETGAEGPLTRTVLGTIVVTELVVVVAFTVLSTITKALTASGASILHSIQELLLAVPGSIVAGLAIGWIISRFMRFIHDEGPLFVLVVGFLVAEVGARLGFEVLLTALTAGVFIRNFTDQGEILHHAIDMGSLPIYVLFFSIAGAKLHLEELIVLIVPAAGLALIRGTILLSGAYAGSRKADAPDVVRKYIGYGLLPQAGLALSIAVLVGNTFPGFGQGASSLLFGIIALNELICPVIYRIALMRSGEAKPAEEAEPAEAAA
jgi:Kef-type K+ transport system membrane component KefB